jgi:hypothetical protein
MSVMEEKLATLEASNRTLNDQLVGLSKSLDTFKSATGSSLDEATKARGDAEGRLAAVEKSLTDIRQSIAGLSASPGGSVDASALADITRRVGELEKQVAALHEAGPATPATGNDDFAELSQALSDLKAKFQAGVPYKEELDKIAIYVPGNTDFADLDTFAMSGLPNAQTLGAELEALAPSLAGSASDGPAAAEASGFWAWVGSVVKVRDLNTLDWTGLAKSAAADAKAGDLKGAVARLEQPGGDLPSALSDWRDKARLRLKAEAAMAQLAGSVTQIIMGKQ